MNDWTGFGLAVAKAIGMVIVVMLCILGVAMLIQVGVAWTGGAL